MSALLVYVAGPYRAATAWGIEQNIQRARAVGALVVAAGAYPVIPHSNTSHFDGLGPDALFLEGTLELLKRCDGLVVLPSWAASEGTAAEVRAAKGLKLPMRLLSPLVDSQAKQVVALVEAIKAARSA